MVALNHLGARLLAFGRLANERRGLPVVIQPALHYRREVDLMKLREVHGVEHKIIEGLLP